MDSNLKAAAVYNDFSGFEKLRQSAREDQSEALEGVAKQFESIFLQMVLKSMRDANSSMKSDLMQSDSTEFYEGMYDQQMALTLSQNNSIGLADVLVRQLSQFQNSKLKDAAEMNKEIVVPLKQASKASSVESSKDLLFKNPVEFIKSLLPSAIETARKLNTDPKILIAQAALETGWGKSVIKHEDGASSFNLFNIKAGKGWSDAKVSVDTLEYENGKAVTKNEPFRSYHSFQQSFEDYFKLLDSNPRYEKAIAAADDPKKYVQELQKAGYATDPTYADKIYKIYNSDLLNGVVNSLMK